MTNSRQQPDFDSHSAKELREILYQLLPSIEKFISVAHKLCEESKTEDSNTSHSNTNHIKPVLPSPTQGRGRKENLIGFYEETLEDIRKIRHQDIFERYDSLKHLLTDEQWLAVYLRFKKGLSFNQIAAQMHRGKSTVYQCLQRAEDEIEKHYKKLRKEKFLLLKKELSE